MNTVSALELLSQVGGAIIAAILASGIGYLKKTPLPKWEGAKFLQTVMWAVVLVFAAQFLGLPLTANPDLVEGKLVDVGIFALLVFATQAIAQLIWRRVVTPLAERFLQRAEPSG